MSERTSKMLNIITTASLVAHRKLLCVYLSLRGVQGSPVIGSDLVKFIKLEAYVLN